MATTDDKAAMSKKIDAVGQMIFDDHPLGITADELGGRAGQLVGQEEGRLFMPEIGDGSLY
jgi:hypothetical protein